MNAKNFWKIVKREVERQKTSFEWLYRKAGIPKGTFSSWKSRNLMPRADAAFRIAGALGVSVEYLLTGADRGGAASNPRVQGILEKMVLLDDKDVDALDAVVEALSGRYRG
jgi:transcriptional regulator with XRE-family HTH domain